MNEQRPAPYVEARSALNGALLAFGLLPLAAEIGCLVAGLATRQPWFFVFMAGLSVLVMISAGLLYRSWPTGLRVDESGISIGAVRSARAARRTPTVSHQSWGLFSCPWPAVRSVRVVTDCGELRRMNASPRYYTLTSRWGNTGRVDHCNTGVLISPFMRAALVVEVDLFDVTASPIRPARYFSNFKDGHFSHLVQPRLSPTWVVPTRHPEMLTAALQAVPGDWDFVNGH